MSAALPPPRRIQRKRTRGWKMPPNTVYVGRPTSWGNPWIVGNGYDAAAVVELYRMWLVGIYNATALPPTPDLRPLRGKHLACWCRIGNPCHADVLLELANR